MRSSNETQADEEEAFFSLPCSPYDQPRPNLNPLAALGEATCEAKATQMPVSGIAPPSTLDDAFNPSKSPGTRKLGGFLGSVKHTRHGYVDSTGERSDDGASDDHSKETCPPPLHGGYLRRPCSGKDKRIPMKTQVDSHQEDEVSIVNIFSLA